MRNPVILKWHINALFLLRVIESRDKERQKNHLASLDITNIIISNNALLRRIIYSIFTTVYEDKREINENDLAFDKLGQETDAFLHVIQGRFTTLVTILSL